MEEEEERGEIVVKATANVHDSHRHGVIYLRLHNSADSESNDPGPPRNPGLPKRALRTKRGCSSRCGMLRY